MSAAPKVTAFDLSRLGEDIRAELIDGVIIPKAASSLDHSDYQGLLVAWLNRRFRRHPGGRWPGGWWISPEIHVAYDDYQVYCHDLAGWRRDRTPELPRRHWIRIMPDWVCEFLSPGHHDRDRHVKLETLRRHEIPHYWIIDSQTKVIEAYRYSSEDYVLVAKVGSGEVLRIEPFAEIELRTAVIFGDEDDEE